MRRLSRVWRLSAGLLAVAAVFWLLGGHPDSAVVTALAAIACLLVADAVSEQE